MAATSERSKALLALGTISFVWGTTFMASRIGVRFIPGLYLSGLRQLIAGGILVIFYLCKGHKIPDKKLLGKLAVLSFFLLVIGNGLSTWSVQYISSGLCAIIAAMLPLWIALFSLFIIKNTQITKGIITGLVLGFIGVIMIFYDSIHGAISTAFIFGVILEVVSMLSWAVGSIYTSKFDLSGVNILFAVGIEMLMAGVALMVICALSGHTADLNNIPREGWLSLGYLVGFGSLVGFGCYIYALSKLPASQVSVYAYINPIIAVALGWAILDERISAAVLIGAAVTIAGVYLVNKGFRSQLG